MSPEELEAVAVAATSWDNSYRSPYWIGVVNPENYSPVPFDKSGKWVVFTNSIQEWTVIANAVASGLLPVEAKISADRKESENHAICVYTEETAASDVLQVLRSLGITSALLWKSDTDTLAQRHGYSSYRYISPKGLEFTNNPDYVTA